MSTQQRSSHQSTSKRSLTRGRTRRKPGSTGKGEYYHIEVRPRDDFVSFQTQDVGKRGHVQRVAGKRFSGYWDTVKWLIGKEDAHVQDKKLIPDTKYAKEVIEQLGSQPVQLVGDRFKASPRRNIPQETKPTPAQKRSLPTNIKKAPAARKKN